MTNLLGGPLAQAIGLALLHTLWEGAIVAGILAALLALLRNRSASIRYAVSCAALATVFVLAIASAWIAYTPATAALPATQPPVGSTDAVVIPGAMPAMSWQGGALAAVAAVRAYVPEIVIAWLAGVLLLSIRLGVSWWRVQSLARRNAIEAGATLHRAASRLAGALGLRRAVRIVVSPAVEVPSVVGFIRPVVLLAVSSVSGLTPEQLEMVLAHELAHIRRHDFLVNAMQSVVETLLFFNPVVWWMSRRIRVERENCCDDLAVSVCGDAVAYARALTQLESMRSAPLAAAAANGGSLADRVRRLVRSNSERTLFSSGWSAAAAITSFVLLLGLATAPLFAERPAAPLPPPQVAGTEVDVQAPQVPEAVPATPATPVAPRAPKAKKVHKHHDGDFDFDFEMPEIVVPEPPIPPDFPQKMKAFAVMAPAIRDQVRASLDAARAGMDAGMAWYAFDDEPSKTPAGKLSVNDLIALKVQGITPEYIDQMRSAGLGDVPIREIVSMHMQGVTPEYVREMRAAGAPVKNGRDVIALKMQDVKPDFIRSLAAAGYDHLSVREIVRLKMFGVNGDFIREMSKYKSK